jgi:hypothetical protein
MLGAFFRAVGAKDVGNEITNLGQMFFGLRNGEQNPILKPQKFDNRPPARGDVWVIRARAVGAVDLWHCSGQSLKEAAKEAADEAPGLKRLLEDKAGLKSSLLSWRRKLRAGELADVAPAAHALYEARTLYIAGNAKKFHRDKLRKAGLDFLRDAERAALDLALEDKAPPIA